MGINVQSVQSLSNGYCKAISKWKEWDFETLLWTVPKEHSKTDEKIIRPIPDDLVPWLLQLKADSD
ncbi:hypothetical protein BOO91_07690 [Vibrio navarrensis]|uniref:hypothetical protein n=1 Tax=Vibrio TaxID=662 RepID=UPI00061ECC2F|nr:MULTISPECIES: hypothetical protein [Vibrio]KJR36890.1 hypothetical protein UF06_04230 [Vibrio sp. S234-5]MBE3652678.1 hypothetical protein [Vibrio navarrensis]MBE3656439.1 hypothetical protein [Vibrio navarrensis]MBE3660821.1 hypothetical protein [Vibrio navarrensis]MBE3669868.1 hypothetical protein [Vibrio navarrensis]